MPTPTGWSRVSDMLPKPGDGASPRSRLIFGVLVLAMMLVLCAPLFVDTVAHDAPHAENGVISYRAWGPLNAPVELSGKWRLVWQNGGGLAPGTRTQASVPGAWADAPGPSGKTLPGTGVARFELELHDLAPGRYLLHVPSLFAASRLYVEGHRVGTHGVVGTDAASTRAEVRGYEVPIDMTGAPVTIGIDVASFQHRDTGFTDPPVLGRAEPMRRWVGLAWAKDLLFIASLLLLGANSAVAFLFRRQDRASLYIALAALCALPGAAVLSYDNMLLLAFPSMGFGLMLALQYLGTDLAVLFFVAYARALFPRECPLWLFRLLLVPLLLFIAAQAGAFLIGDTLLASRIAIVWPIVAGISFAGIIAVVIRAARRGRDAAAIFLLGIAIFAMLFVNATLVWSGVAPSGLLPGATTLPLGMLVLLFSHVVVAAQRWSLAIIAAERRTDELSELIEVSALIASEMNLEALLGRIVEAASRILDADRSTLLLHDPKTDELRSLIAEGMDARPLRFPSDLGLGGHAFTHGETVNVANAYADPRFNAAFDEATGYRTRNLLAMPIATRDGRRLGVMQALNRRDGRPFDRDDARRMGAFAGQAAIAIENATLFSEVVASRNYNESILRSMSSGVVTIDRDAEFAKLNAAAQRILGVPEGGLEGRDARALLAETNPWLIAEVDAVNATGEPKLLLDVDVRTGGGQSISANLSIVPLMSEGERVGLLLLVEDISEGKRLQGAMRRFMTQKVVDQVLQQQDDLLFGTACHASVLFADIRNFTSMAELLTPRETVDMLNEAFTEFFEAVAASEGVLDKFIGDAIMAVYGAPLSTGRDPENAVESGVHMLRTLSDLNHRRAGRTLPPLRLGIGIATGEVVAGTIGSPKRMDYTVIGDSVNLAARLQDLTKSYGVEMLLCEETAAAVHGHHRLRELDLILVRGRSRPATIFQVLAPGASDAGWDAYSRGRGALAARDWAGAVAAFEEAARAAPEDRPAEIMLERARALAAAPPAADWDGIWRGAGQG
jgi:adenylate cyclase